MVATSGFDQTIEHMVIHLDQAEGTLILFAVSDDPALRDYTLRQLRKRLPAGIALRNFEYDPAHLSLLEGALEVAAPQDGRRAVSATGLDTLPRDKQTEAIQLLNLQRNRFGRTGIAAVLWVDRATLARVSSEAADFYS